MEPLNVAQYIAAPQPNPDTSTYLARMAEVRNANSATNYRNAEMLRQGIEMFQKQRESKSLSQLAQASIDPQTRQLDYDRFSKMLDADPDVSFDTKQKVSTQITPKVQQQILGQLAQRNTVNGQLNEDAYINDIAMNPQLGPDVAAPQQDRLNKKRNIDISMHSMRLAGLANAIDNYRDPTTGVINQNDLPMIQQAYAQLGGKPNDLAQILPKLQDKASTDKFIATYIDPKITAEKTRQKMEERKQAEEERQNTERNSIARFNAETGRLNAETNRTGGGKGGKDLDPDTGKPFTAAKMVAAGYALRASEANAKAEQLYTDGFDAGKVSNAIMKPEKLNLIKDPKQRQYAQTARNFINAILRPESGAVIAESEFKDAYRQYFAQPGDDAETQEQKRLNRLQKIAGLKAQAGSAYEKTQGQYEKELGGTPKKTEQLPKFNNPTDPEFKKLPSGSKFIDSNGVTRIKH